jgi:EAL domain-containing protein (putative c-di-GMP-specific phosphodiesterase class I)
MNVSTQSHPGSGGHARALARAVRHHPIPIGALFVATAWALGTHLLQPAFLTETAEGVIDVAFVTLGATFLLIIYQRGDSATERGQLALAAGERGRRLVATLMARIQRLLAPGRRARRDESALRARIGSLIERAAFHPVFQPIVELETGRAIGFEALTRFDDETAPDVLFTQARGVGCGASLEAATLAAAIGQASALPDGCWLSLNVSPAFAISGALEAILAGRVRPIVIEVTEHEIVDDYPALRAAITALGSDVRVAVDDAGAGVANFRHIVELRPDFVKLDVSLIGGLDGDLTRQALIVGLRMFARTTGRLLIAEGVATETERETLLSLGVRLGQGFLLGRPADSVAVRLIAVTGRTSSRLPSAARCGRDAGTRTHELALTKHASHEAASRPAVS